MRIKNILIIAMSMFLISCDYHPPILAGGEDAGFVDGLGEKAKFGKIWSSGVVDSDGNLYVIDNNRIRKITPDGIVSTYAGTGERDEQDGDIKKASFSNPWQLFLDNKNNMFINDNGKKIKKITPEGVVSTIIGSDKYFEAYSNNKLVKIEIGELNLAGFDINQNLYFSNNYLYYKLDKDNIITEFTEIIKFTDSLYNSECIGFNPKSLELYFEQQEYNFSYYYKLNLLTSTKTKLFTLNAGAKRQVIFTEDGVGYQLYNSNIFKVDENLTENKTIYSFYFRASKSGKLGLDDSVGTLSAYLTLDEKRKILYVIESGYYHRIYKINLN